LYNYICVVTLAKWRICKYRRFYGRCYWSWICT